MKAQVLLPKIFNFPFTYKTKKEKLSPGDIVEVPFGKEKAIGVVWPDESFVPKNIKITHISLFDKSLQGIEFIDSPAFSFQGHPEASPGPQEIQNLFKKFSLMVKEYAKT